MNRAWAARDSGRSQRSGIDVPPQLEHKDRGGPCVAVGQGDPIPSGLLGMGEGRVR